MTIMSGIKYQDNYVMNEMTWDKKHIKESWYDDMTSKSGNISTYSNVMMRHVSMTYPETRDSGMKMQELKYTHCNSWHEIHDKNVRYFLAGWNRYSPLSPKMRLPQFSSHAVTLPDQSNAILRQPRAKIIASRLHYSLFTIATDNFR